MVENLPAVQEMQDMQVRSLRQEDPMERKWLATPVLLAGKSPGPRSLEGYSPRGHKASDTTGRLSMHINFLERGEHAVRATCIDHCQHCSGGIRISSAEEGRWRKHSRVNQCLWSEGKNGSDPKGPSPSVNRHPFVREGPQGRICCA